MAKIPGSISLTGVVAPADDADNYPVIDPQYGIDGLRNVATPEDLYAIPPLRRKLGMMVGVGINGTAGSYYYLTSDSGDSVTTSGNWSLFEPGGAIAFFDEAAELGTYSKVNFVGEDVVAQANPTDSTMLNIYIPAPIFASHFNQNDGALPGTVSETGITRYPVRISTPTNESIASPFKAGTWAATTQSATLGTTPVYSTANPVTGLGGNANVNVIVYDADGTTELANYTTPSIIANATHTSGDSRISVAITQFAQDSLKKKGKIVVTVQAGGILSDQGRSGGRYQIKITNKTDSATDGGVNYVYLSSPVFLDINSTTPGFNVGSTVTLAESSPTNTDVVTKYLSGVQYYTLGSLFDVGANGLNNLNGNTQGSNFSASNNVTVTASAFGLPAIAVKAWEVVPAFGAFSNWTNVWNVQGVSYAASDWEITATNFRYRGNNAAATMTLFDPWGSSSPKSSAAQKVLVDTYSTSGNSTTLIERFDDEQYRLQSNYTTPWQSNTSLSNGEACVAGGELIMPYQFRLTDPNQVQADLALYLPNKTAANPNYSALQDDAKYFRIFQRSSPSNTPIPSFTMVFTGQFFTGTALGDLEEEYLKIFVRKISGQGNTGVAMNPLILHTQNVFDDPYDDGNSYPYIRTGDSAGNTIKGSFGVWPASQGIYTEIRICSPTIRIYQIDVSFA